MSNVVILHENISRMCARSENERRETDRHILWFQDAVSAVVNYSEANSRFKKWLRPVGKLRKKTEVVKRRRCASFLEKFLWKIIPHSDCSQPVAVRWKLSSKFLAENDESSCRVFAWRSPYKYFLRRWKALAVNLSRTCGQRGLYASLIGSNPRQLKAP